MASKTYGTKIGFTGILTIVFIVLKVTEVIDWQWIWVLSPLWIGVAVFLVILILGLLAVSIFK